MWATRYIRLHVLPALWKAFRQYIYFRPERLSYLFSYSTVRYGLDVSMFYWLNEVRNLKNTFERVCRLSTSCNNIQPTSSLRVFELPLSFRCSRHLVLHHLIVGRRYRNGSFYESVYHAYSWKTHLQHRRARNVQDWNGDEHLPPGGHPEQFMLEYIKVIRVYNS